MRHKTKKKGMDVSHFTNPKESIPRLIYIHLISTMQISPSRRNRLQASMTPPRSRPGQQQPLLARLCGDLKTNASRRMKRLSAKNVNAGPKRVEMMPHTKPSLLLPVMRRSRSSRKPSRSEGGASWSSPRHRSEKRSWRILSRLDRRVKMRRLWSAQEEVKPVGGCLVTMRVWRRPEWQEHLGPHHKVCEDAVNENYYS